MQTETIQELAAKSLTPSYPEHIKKIFGYLEKDTKTDSTAEMTMGILMECLTKPVESRFPQSYKFSINYNFNRQGLRPEAHDQADQMEDYLKEAKLRTVEVSQVVDGMIQVNFYKGNDQPADPAIIAYPLEGVHHRGKTWIEVTADVIYTFLLSGGIFQ